MNTIRILVLKFEILLYQVAIECLSRKYWLPIATKQLTANITLHILESKQKQRNY